jgi:YVTN family beta-propeller protein
VIRRPGLSAAIVVGCIFFASVIPAAHFLGPSRQSALPFGPQSHEQRQSPPFAPSAETARLLQHRLVTTQLEAGGSQSFPYLSNASGLAYAPWDKSFYVAAPPSSVDVISATDYSVVAVIPVGNAPFGVATDDAAKEVFVTNGASDNVTVISGSILKAIGSVEVQKDPQGIAFDSADGALYVTDNGSNDVTEIAVGSLSVVATVPVGSSPLGIAWDSATGKIFVADRGSNQVTVISGATAQVLATIPVGSGPYGVAVDNLSDTVYVSNQGSSNVSVISAETDSLSATVPVGPTGGTINVQGIAYDSAHRVVWVGAGTFFAVVINTTTEAVEDYVATDPSGVAFDPDNGDVCVTNTANFTFACFVFRGAFFPSWTPATVTFSESGLPAGTPWSVTLRAARPGNVTQVSATATIVFEVFTAFSYPYPYNYSYVVGPVTGYLASPATGYVASSSGANISVGIAYTGSPRFYPVTFIETGLPTGARWNITINGSSQGSTTTSITFTLPNGTYNWTVSTIGGYITTWSGTATIHGTALTIKIRFAPFAYPVVFGEGGLPVTSGAVPPWSVAVDGGIVWSTAYFLTYELPNGTWTFTVGVPTGYIATPASGNITVSAGPTTEGIIFSQIPATYAVTLTETGLPSGFIWSAYLNGQSQSGPQSTFVFDVPNGTYTYSIVVGPPGYTFTSSAASNTVTVKGAAVAVSVAISAVSTGTSGLDKTTGLSTLAYLLIGVLAALAVISLVLALYFARRKPPMSRTQLGPGHPPAPP